MQGNLPHHWPCAACIRRFKIKKCFNMKRIICGISRSYTKYIRSGQRPGSLDPCTCGTWRSFCDPPWKGLLTPSHASVLIFKTNRCCSGICPLLLMSSISRSVNSRRNGPDHDPHDCHHLRCSGSRPTQKSSLALSICSNAYSSTVVFFLRLARNDVPTHAPKKA